MMMIKKIALLLPLVAWRIQQAAASIALPLTMEHPNHEFEAIYLRKYIISKDEAETLSICQTLTHDCEWGLIVVIRQESCIPNDVIIDTYKTDERAHDCPLLVQGYSVYDSDNTSPDVIAHKHHLTNMPGVDLPVFVFHRGSYQWEQLEHGAFTYQDLVDWADEDDNVYRGVAKEFFESQSNNAKADNVINGTKVEDEDLIDEGDLTVIVKGILDDDYQFTFTIDEVGDTFIPIIWDIALTKSNPYDSDDDGLEEGGLAGAIIGAAVFGVLVGSLLTMLFMRSSQGAATSTTPAATTSATGPHKEMDPTESQTEAHQEAEPTKSSGIHSA